MYFRVASFPEYGRLSGQRPDQVEEQEPNALKEDPRDFALWKANKEGEDTAWDSPWGRGRPGLAHRVLGDGRGAARPELRDPRRRARPRLPAPRERARAVACARPPVRADLGAQRDARVHRREDVEVGRQHRDAARGARRVGARGDARLLPDRALAQADRLLAGDDGAGGGAGGELPQRLSRARASRAATGMRSRRRSRTTSTRPRRWRCCTAGATTTCCGGRSRSSGSSRSLAGDEAPRRDRRARRAPGRRRARSATSRRPTGCATRSRPRAGRCGTSPAATRSSASR